MLKFDGFLDGAMCEIFCKLLKKKKKNFTRFTRRYDNYPEGCCDMA